MLGMFPSLNAICTPRLCVSSVPGWQPGEALTLDHSILGCLRLPLKWYKADGEKMCQTKEGTVQRFSAATPNTGSSS